MQVFRLVEPGLVDRVISFDELPKSLLVNVRRGGIEGFPRHWKDFMGVDKNAKDPHPFFILEYTMLNSDKERWQEISNYVRAVADKKVRLLDHLSDMAVPLAPDSYSQLTLEPEDIPVIPVPLETESEDSEISPVAESIKKAETPKKKAGRPRKEHVAA